MITTTELSLRMSPTVCSCCNWEAKMIINWNQASIWPHIQDFAIEVIRKESNAEAIIHLMCRSITCWSWLHKISINKCRQKANNQKPKLDSYQGKFIISSYFHKIPNMGSTDYLSQYTFQAGTTVILSLCGKNINPIKWKWISLS